MPAPGDARADQGRQPPLPRRGGRRATTRSGESTSGRSARSRCAPRSPRPWAAGPRAPFGEALEIGSGTGYFSLNLLQLGLIGRLVATDISPGMLDELAATAERLGLDVETEATDAERLPFEDGSFDLVFGHAVLHHLPDLAAALAEFRRVLRPGGTLAFCGEPSRYGDLLAAVPKRGAQRRGAALAAAARGPGATRGPGRAPTTGTSSSPRWTCTPSPPRRSAGCCARPGSRTCRIRGEELLANVYGWTVRTLEGTADPERGPRPLAPARLPQLPRPPAPRRGAARAAPARPRCSTTWCSARARQRTATEA